MNNLIKEATPFDSIQETGYFSNDNLSFCASAILNGFTIEKVKFHPSKIGVKVFYFKDSQAIRNYYQDFSNGLLAVDPQALSFEISKVKNLQVDKLPQERKLNPDNYLDQFEIAQREKAQKTTFSGNQLMTTGKYLNDSKREGGGE